MVEGREGSVAVVFFPQSANQHERHERHLLWPRAGHIPARRLISHDTAERPQCCIDCCWTNRNDPTTKHYKHDVTSYTVRQTRKSRAPNSTRQTTNTSAGLFRTAATAASVPKSCPTFPLNTTQHAGAYSCPLGIQATTTLLSVPFKNQRQHRVQVALQPRQHHPSHPNGEIERGEGAHSFDGSARQESRGDGRQPVSPRCHAEGVCQEMGWVSSAVVLRDHPRFERCDQQGSTGA